jgi:hypothetical protein
VKGFILLIQGVTFSPFSLSSILVEAWFNACGKIKPGVMKTIRQAPLIFWITYIRNN